MPKKKPIPLVVRMMSDEAEYVFELIEQHCTPRSPSPIAGRLYRRFRFIHRRLAKLKAESRRQRKQTTKRKDQPR